jgi:hypothetical protein
MQHLLVHISYEAKVGSPMQYRWMYHIKRALKYLISMVGNRARVEGCIVESFLLKEITYFSSVYFAEEHNVNVVTLRYNVAARPIIIFKKNERLICSTCRAIWKRWICFSCKYPLYFLPPYSSISRSYSFICLYSEFDKQNWRSNR